MSSVIYKSDGKANEYSTLACNLFIGCRRGGGCVYCYAAGMSGNRDKFHNEPRSKKGILTRLAKDARRHGRKLQLDLFDQDQEDPGQVLLCFTTDPYQANTEFLRITRQAIRILHGAGYGVCILTKGGGLALQDLDLFGDRDAFGTTLTLLDETRSEEWEPRAASPQARIDTIKAFNAAGIRTWVSLEPVLDPVVALEIIRRTHKYVDHYKVGTLNYVERLPAYFQKQVFTINWRKFGWAVTECLEEHGYVGSAVRGEHKPGTFYIKDSLARWL